jgi:hypothetical protein
MSKTFREASRRDWAFDGSPTVPEIQLGCMQRIASATELMAKRYQDLIDQCDYAEKGRSYWRDQYEKCNRSRNAARGQITKLKNRLAAKEQK